MNISQLIPSPRKAIIAAFIIGGLVFAASAIGFYHQTVHAGNALSFLSENRSAPQPAHVKTSTIPQYHYRITAVYPHDPQAFTQGLVYTNGYLYESTGLYGRSSLRKVELKTGKIIQYRKLPDKHFGEGIALINNEIYQLTWKARTGYRYNAETFELIAEFSYPTEGWGLTYNGESVILSDGTPVVYFYNPQTFTELRRITVTDDRGPVRYINELEYIQGEIFANVWQTDYIVRIDPHSGKVTGRIDLSALRKSLPMAHKIDVLNGIAYNPETQKLLVTGKLWPKLFEIKLTDKE